MDGYRFLLVLTQKLQNKNFSIPKRAKYHKYHMQSYKSKIAYDEVFLKYTKKDYRSESNFIG